MQQAPASGGVYATSPPPPPPPNAPVLVQPAEHPSKEAREIALERMRQHARAGRQQQLQRGRQAQQLVGRGRAARGAGCAAGAGADAEQLLDAAHVGVHEVCSSSSQPLSS